MVIIVSFSQLINTLNETMNSVRLTSLSLKYKLFTPSGCKHIGIRKFEFVVKTLKSQTDFTVKRRAVCNLIIFQFLIFLFSCF